MGETTNIREHAIKYCIGLGLDLGCGGDKITPHSIGFDLPQPYFQAGNDVIEMKGDARFLPFNDNVLDYIFSSHLLEDFTDTAGLLKEWLRVIKPNGYLVLYLPDELRYREYCKQTNQGVNGNHKIIMSSDYLKSFLTDYKIVECFENSYSFFYVVQKTPSELEKGKSYFGRCFVCNKNISFVGTDNLRESLICPYCGLNRRQRSAFQYISNVNNYSNKIYINELGAFYNALKKLVPQENLVGSEYLNSINNQDATNLTFADESFDMYLSFEVFEHIPNYIKAFSEACRILKPGGRLIFSVPFIEGYPNLKRAIIENGEIKHLETPEYHGDPLSDEGCLCFTHFGLEMLDELKSIGFKEAKVIQLTDEAYGIYGIDYLFEAVK